MRTASRRARRFGGLLLLAATVWWAFLRRRANAVRWVEPPATLPAGPEPGVPGELPDDVIATDAGLTELPEDSAQPGTVDEANWKLRVPSDYRRRVRLDLGRAFELALRARGRR